jgi:hypothetical protein
VGFRSPLDLSDILPLYREHLGAFGGTVGVNFVDGNGAPEVKPDAIPRFLYAPERLMPEDPERIGNGPQTCSTCTDLVWTKPTFAWDINGWYRTIGATWPYVQYTPSMLSRAYIAAGGQKSARATYYLTRLLDKPSRALYDAAPLGVVYLDDRYVEDAMKAKAQAEASRRSKEGSFTEAVEVLDEWGYVIEKEDEAPLDSEQSQVLDEPTPETESYEPIEWVYAYWSWKSRGRGAITRLERWQTLLVSALSVRGARVNLAVGLMGKQPQDWVIGRFDKQWIVFLNDHVEPTLEMAVNAADALMKDLDKNLN